MYTVSQLVFLLTMQERLAFSGVLFIMGLVWLWLGAHWHNNAVNVQATIFIVYVLLKIDLYDLTGVSYLIRGIAFVVFGLVGLIYIISMRLNSRK